MTTQLYQLQAGARTEWELRHERDGRSTVHYIKVGTGNVYGQRGVGQTEAEIIEAMKLMAIAPRLLERIRWHSKSEYEAISREISHKEAR